MRVSMRLLGVCLLSASILSSCVDDFAAGVPLQRAGYPSINPDKVITSEELLLASDGVELVELGSSVDPAEAHINARKKVNVKRRSKKNELSANFKPNAKSGEDGKLRILRLSEQEPDLALVEEVEDSVDTEISNVVSAVAPLSNSKPKAKAVKEAFIIIPKIKPYVAMKKYANSVKARELSKKYVVPKVKPLVSKSKRRVVNSGVRASVVKLRSGVHKGNTRVVIELSSIPEYAAVIDPLRNVLSVNIENTRWNIDKHSSLKVTPLLGSYVARENDDGATMLEIRLKGSAEIVNTMVLPPNKSSKHRIVIDLR